MQNLEHETGKSTDEIIIAWQGLRDKFGLSDIFDKICQLNIDKHQTEILLKFRKSTMQAVKLLLSNSDIITIKEIFN